MAVTASTWRPGRFCAPDGPTARTGISPPMAMASSMPDATVAPWTIRLTSHAATVGLVPP